MKKVYQWLEKGSYKATIEHTTNEIIITVANVKLIRRKVNPRLTVWRVEVNGLLLNEYSREADLLRYVQQVYPTTAHKLFF